jgi:serine/threonine protein kinase
MSPERHQYVRGLFDQVVERPQEERLSYLQQACQDDTEALQTVLRLLDAHGHKESLLQTNQSHAWRSRYYILGELGRGAMGIVYRAFDPVIDRTVAIKTIRLESIAEPQDVNSMREQLLNEARSAGKLSHPGIVTIYDVGQENENLAFIVMEFVEGCSLQDVLDSKRKLETAGVLDILRQVAEALDYSHQKSIVHRDIKPSNILLHQTSTVKVTDFGIARIASSGVNTGTGIVMGTPRYMSPEQINSQRVDGRSDQFSLAVVAFELLCGTHPFLADNLQSLFHRILTQPVTSARKLNPDLPSAADGVFLRALAKQPSERYQTCAEFVSALALALDAKIGEREVVHINREVQPENRQLAAWLPSVSIPALVIAFVLRIFFNTSSVTRDRPLNLLETAIVFVVVLAIGAVIRYLFKVARRHKRKSGP